MQLYSNFLQEINEALQQQEVALQNSRPAEMYNPMSYIVSLGGKRIRPLLTLIACDLFNGIPKNAISAAMAVEFFHNFSLVHDDILDNAPLRRGNKTVHEKWSANIALLSGDGMLVKAYETLSRCNTEHLKELLEIFSATGLLVCEGQQLDMNFETQNSVSVNDYIEMITRKTAVLLGCSLQMGAICANAPKAEQLNIHEFGKNIGIAFQLLDDVLDVYATKSEFGKQVGGDIIANKKTFLLLKAFELSNDTQKLTLTLLIEDKTIPDTTKISKVSKIFDELGVKEIAIKKANVYTERAFENLTSVIASEDKKNELRQFCLRLLNRNF